MFVLVFRLSSPRKLKNPQFNLLSNMDNSERFPIVTNKGKPLSPFISKLKLLLNDVKYRRAIRWSENGAAIVITDGETFKKLVLDRSEEMFKTRNFTSFVRQLNLYGFRKVPVSGKADPAKNMKFDHTFFKRDRPELMYQVRRTCTPSKKKRKACFTGSGGKKASPEPYREQYDDSDLAAEEDTASDSSLCVSSFMQSTPNKHSLTNNFNHSSNSPFVPPPREGESWNYMYRKFEDELLAVQLLLSLRHSSPSQMPERFQPTPPYDGVYPTTAGCSCCIYPSPPFHAHVPHYDIPMDLPHLAQ